MNFNFFSYLFLLFFNITECTFWEFDNHLLFSFYVHQFMNIAEVSLATENLIFNCYLCSSHSFADFLPKCFSPILKICRSWRQRSVKVDSPSIFCSNILRLLTLGQSDWFCQTFGDIFNYQHWIIIVQDIEAIKMFFHYSSHLVCSRFDFQKSKERKFFFSV